MNHASLLAASPGVRTIWNYDDVTGVATVETLSDVGAMMERNQREFREWNDYSRMGDMVKVGSIPLAKYFALKKQGIIDDWDPQQRRFLRWCHENYREYSKWFSAPKRVIL